VANLEGVSLSGYKVVKPQDFAYVPDTSRRGDKVSYGFNDEDATYLVSSISIVFEVKEKDELEAGYLNLWLCRPEFDRYARFNSWGSARETFNWADMCRVKIPLPPIEVQQAIVDVYRCANEAKKIAEEADRLSREICPALVRWAAEGGGA
jgi:type I restriction enzyme S subunit